MGRAFNIDSDGHIIIDDSMSEKLKAKITAYNAGVDQPELVEQELSDAEADAYDVPADEDDYDESDDDYVVVEIDDDESVDEEKLNDLNDLFS
jgi:hypothetical protein